MWLGIGFPEFLLAVPVILLFALPRDVLFEVSLPSVKSS
jgi:hypothetical protein